MESQPSKITESLALEAIEIASGSVNDLERACWLAVHKYHHGVMPSEYDIREIDEALYLSVLEISKVKCR